MPQSFHKKTVLITGSSSGIGKGAALFFAQEGANVMLASRTVSANEELTDEIVAKGGNAAFVQTDVSRPEEVQRMVKFAVETYGTIDIALNNAGIEGISYSC